MEDALHHRFATRSERFVHGQFAIEMLLPTSAEDLIDERDFDVDERLPYWAELWPSARALTRYLLEQPLSRGRALELGAGLALPSLALLWRGAEVRATDYYDDALQFAKANAARLGLSLPTQLLDWRTPPPELGHWDLVIAADVLYERRNIDALVTVLPQVVAAEGEVLLADPGRVYLGEFLRIAEQVGWRTEPVAVRDEGASRIQVWRLRDVGAAS